jgi:hypothetical protein
MTEEVRTLGDPLEILDSTQVMRRLGLGTTNRVTQLGNRGLLWVAGTAERMGLTESEVLRRLRDRDPGIVRIEPNAEGQDVVVGLVGAAAEVQAEMDMYATNFPLVGRRLGTGTAARWAFPEWAVAMFEGIERKQGNPNWQAAPPPLAGEQPDEPEETTA